MKAPLSLRLGLDLLRGQAPRAWLFALCVAVGVAARTGVGSFLASLDASLQRESRLLLGADLEISGRAPLEPGRRAQLLGLLPPGSRTSERVSLLTMASTAGRQAGRTRMVQLGAVDRDYPLAGRLVLEGAAGASTAAALQSGRLLYAQRELLTQLGVAPGGSVRLGSLDFTVAGVLVDEPGLGPGAFSLGPRVLIGAGQAASAGLTGFGSSVSYETLAALPDPLQAEPFARRLRSLWGIPERAGFRGQPPPAGTLRLRSPRDAENDLKRFFDRLADYLGLVSLAALLLGGVGVASVMRGFVREAAVPLGILRSVGAGPAFTREVFAWQSLALGLVGSLLGAAAGLLGQAALAAALGGFLPVALTPAWSPLPPLWGMFLGLLTALAFGLEPVLAAAGQSTASLLRDEEPPAGPRLASAPLLPAWSPALAWRAACAAAFAVVAGLEAHSWSRGSGSFAALGVGALLLNAAGDRLLPLASRGRSLPVLASPRGFPLRHALANLGRPGLRAGASLVALGCAALLLGVLAVYQHSLLEELRPARDRGRVPDLFLIDLQKGQVEPLRALVASLAPDAHLELSPMVKARYRGKVGDPPPAAGQTGTAPGTPQGSGRTRDDEDGRSMREREQNLSWRNTLGPGESLSKGVWMDPAGKDVEASLEEWYAERLGARLGDVLRFDVQGVEVQARVSSLRKVDWASFQPNFFVLLSPWALQDAPQTWIASASRAGQGAGLEALQAEVVRRFPNVTLFEVAHAAAKIEAILDRIAGAVRLVALACLATGLAVLAGLALASARSRRFEAALLKVLGGSRGQILAATAWEFGLLSALAGLLGLALSLAFGWVLLDRVLELEFHVPWLLLLGLEALFTATGSLTGVAASWGVYQASPAEVLRQD